MQTATISASWFLLQVQLLKIPVVIGFLPMDNGNAYDQLSFLDPAAEPAVPGYYGSWGLASGNGECRRISRTCCQGRWSCTMSTTQWCGGRLTMEPMEGATDPEKIYSKLWGKVVAIIKFLPPCKLWLKFHDFWKGLKFILLLVITFSSTQIDTPSQMP